MYADTMATAIDVGTLAGNRAFDGAVSAADVSDYYRFTLPNRSDFALTLSGLSADADVRVVRPNGSVVAGGYNGGNRDEAIRQLLDAGTYYAQVYRYSGNTGYHLALGATPNTVPDNAGNSLGAARDVGVLSGSRSFNDFVGQADTNDYYRFTLTTRSNFNLRLDGLLSDADVHLLNGSGQVIASSTYGGNFPEAIATTLDPGVYFVRVYPYGSANTPYSLTLTATAVATVPDYAGNTLGTARDAGALSGSRSFSDFVGQADANDYYRFTLSNRSLFNLRLDRLSADADVYLLNSNGQVIGSSTYGGSNPEAIAATLDAGVYFVRVFPWGAANTNYTLTLTATTLYDATVPAPGTTEIRQWVPTNPPVRSTVSDRSATLYTNVINQFAVGVNPRHQPTATATYCNIFSWDVMRAMGAEIPHWVDTQDRPVIGRQPNPNQGDRELNANATAMWLRNRGATYGWTRVDASEAQRVANLGRPAVVTWYNPGGIGHIAVVRPGSIDQNGPTIAQAGGRNFNVGHVYDGFPRSASLEYWVHG
jgi:hypothetical protein